MCTPQGLQGPAMRLPLALAAVAAAALAAGCDGCGGGAHGDPDVGDIGDVDASGDADADIDGSGDTDGSGDATPRAAITTSPAGGTITGDANRMNVRFGGPPPVGAASGSGHGIVVGPGAARP